MATRPAAWLLLAALPALVLPAPASSPATLEHGGHWRGAAWAGAAAAGLALAAAALLLGCVWCRTYTTCKPDQNGDFELFGAGGRSPLERGGAASEAELRAHAAPPAAAPPPRARDDSALEDNNNGPISLRELQNIANNNAAAYITGAHEHARALRFEPLPALAPPPLRDWLAPEHEELPRERLQYVRELGRGSFGRIVAGELQGAGAGAGGAERVAVRVLDSDATPAQRASFLRAAAVFRDARHARVLPLRARSLLADPWILVFPLYTMDLDEYLSQRRRAGAAPGELGAALRLLSDAAAGLAHVHQLGRVYGSVWPGGVLVQCAEGQQARAALGHYGDPRDPRLPPWTAPEMMADPDLEESASSEMWSVGVLLQEMMSLHRAPGDVAAGRAQACVYTDHLYQVMQMCCNAEPTLRPSAAQVEALLDHLYTSHLTSQTSPHDAHASGDFERRWQTLKPNSIPVVDEHIAIVHNDVRYSRDEFRRDPSFLTVPSRSSSIMSDNLVHNKSDSLTNLHGSLEDIRDALQRSKEASIEPVVEKCDSNAEPSGHSSSQFVEKVDPVDPWLAEVAAENSDDVGYYRDVSDVIKNLDSILNSEKTSSSESSHQASPAREQLGLNVTSPQRLNPPSSLVKSPGISDFKSILEELPLEPQVTAEECKQSPHETPEHVNATQDHKEIEMQPATISELKTIEKEESLSVENVCESVASNNNNNKIKSDEEKSDYVISSRSVPSLKDLCANRTNSSVNSVKVQSETEDCAEFCDNYNLLNAVESIVDIPSDVTESDGKEEVNTPENIIKELELPTSLILYSDIKLNVDKRKSQDVSEEIEVDSEKHSVSDTEVLSMDNDSTIYMDLKSSTVHVFEEQVNYSLNKGIEKNMDKFCEDLGKKQAEKSLKVEGDRFYDSTQYMDLPQVMRETSAFIHSEKSFASSDIMHSSSASDVDKREFDACNVLTSTPNTVLECNATNDHRVDFNEQDSQAIPSLKENIPNYCAGTKVIKLKQQIVPETFSRLVETAPTPTEESSVVLGPFENCTLDYFTGIKTVASHSSDSPKEELLAFSSNFVEFNLNSGNISFTDDAEAQAIAQPSHIPLGPTTPPNSPGNYLLPHQEYVNEPNDSPSGPNSIIYEPADLTNIHLTAKLAMAENENNLNIEYSIVEEPLPPDSLESAGDEVGILTPPECNEYPEDAERPCGGNELVGWGREGLDDECVRALRNELELKLPLAQASGGEPLEDCPLELPPPPSDEEEESEGRSGGGELVVCYPAALSPILEETDPQLNAYHNNLNWTQRTDSSESYLEPCNNSTDELTDLVTAVRSEPRAPLPLDSRTYTLRKDTDNIEISMSTDSLNTDDGTLKDIAMPSMSVQTPQLPQPEILLIKSPTDTDYERISQISPCILSPSYDSCKISTDKDFASNVSKLSKPTLPSDVKSSNTQCLSKGTSMDSWCSNDTLFNVEDHFDELADCEGEDDNKSSSSSETLAKQNGVEDAIDIIESHEESNKANSPNSIDEHTYTLFNVNLAKEESCPEITRDLSEINMETKINGDAMCNGIEPHISDDAIEIYKRYDMLDRGSHYFENRLELLNREEMQPIEQMRESEPFFNMTPPIVANTSLKDTTIEVDRPKPSMSKMDSIDVPCQKAHFSDHLDVDDVCIDNRLEFNGDILSPELHYMGMAQSVTSTPLIVDCKSEQDQSEILPALVFNTPQSVNLNIPDFEIFVSSAEQKPQDVSLVCQVSPHITSVTSEDSSAVNGSQHDNVYSLCFNGHSSTEIEKKTSEYAEFESSAKCKPQELSLNENDTIDIRLERLQQKVTQNIEVPSSSKNQVNGLDHDVDIECNPIFINNTESSELAGIEPSEPFKVSQEETYFVVKNIDGSTDNDNKAPSIIIMEEYQGDIHSYAPIQTSRSGIEFKDNTCPSFSNFDSSAATKPQELSSFSNNQNCAEVQDSSPAIEFSFFERSAIVRPQEISPESQQTVNSSQLSQNFNDTFQTFDSHKTQRRPEIINANDRTELGDSSQDTSGEGNKDKEQNENLQMSEEKHTDDPKNKEEYNCECEKKHSDSNKQGTLLVTNVSDTVKLDESTGIIEISTNNTHPQEDLGFYEPIESKHDSLVSVSHSQSDETNIDKEISTSSAVEESEPTTRDMDSLENNLELVDEEVVSQSKISDQTSEILDSSVRKLVVNTPDSIDNDSEVDRAIEELDQVLEANGDDEDVRSASPCSCTSDVHKDRPCTEPPSRTDTYAISCITNTFIEHEKNFSEINAYLPMLRDIHFTGPSADCMSTSFSQDSPTEDASMMALECELKRAEENASRLGAESGAAGALREWESESEDSHTTSTSSGEFIWKDGAGEECCLTTTTDFDHDWQHGSGAEGGREGRGSRADDASDASDDSDGSDGDEVEFVPSSWDCRAAPAKSSLKSLEQTPVIDNKKRVVFKRQKYHCVYEYPREAGDDAGEAPRADYVLAAWQALGGRAAELSYAFPDSAPRHLYRLPGDPAYSPNYGLPDEDFFISSSARPFESLGIMSTTSQFFPGLHAALKSVEPDAAHDAVFAESPLVNPPEMTHTGSLDFTTPDSGVEDVTPGSTLEEEPPPAAPALSPTAAARSRLKLCAPEAGSSSSESPSPGSPCPEALGGLRHTRDRLKLDLPPSPLNLTPTTRHGQRVFNFLSADAAPPLVMTDETPQTRVTSLPLDDDEDDVVVPEPTFSTFGKPGAAAAPLAVPSQGKQTTADEEKVAEANSEKATELDTIVLKNKSVAEAVRGEGTVLDSGDEDSGIESSAKTTLERTASCSSHTASI